MADALITVECPPDIRRIARGSGLSPEELCVEYKIPLQDQALVPEKKAVDAYVLTLERARDFKVVNKWTKEAEERLNFLRPNEYPLEKKPKTKRFFMPLVRVETSLPQELQPQGDVAEDSGDAASDAGNAEDAVTDAAAASEETSPPTSSFESDPPARPQQDAEVGGESLAPPASSEEQTGDVPAGSAGSPNASPQTETGGDERDEADTAQPDEVSPSEAPSQAGKPSNDESPPAAPGPPPA